MFICGKRYCTDAIPVQMLGRIEDGSSRAANYLCNEHTISQWLLDHVKSNRQPARM